MCCLALGQKQLLALINSPFQVEGKVDQSGAMISEDVAEKGYALLCVAQPTQDCKITTISEVCVSLDVKSVSMPAKNNACSFQIFPTHSAIGPFFPS